MAQIILTCDRTLAADYRILLEGVFGTVITDATLKWTYEHFVSRKPLLAANGELAYPPYGLRKIQSALLSAGFGRDDIVIVPPNRISSFIDEWTKIIGVSSGDPLGIGMTSTTMRCLWGGTPYTEKSFFALSKSICKLKSDKNGIKFCYGGPGAWQFKKRPEAAQSLGIDHVLFGYGDRTVPLAFRKIIDGQRLPLLVYCEQPTIEDIRPIIAPSSMGIVEISRGCGRGCQFCTMGDKKMMHIPEGIIVQEIERNVEGGVKNICLLSEDFLRYGSDSIGVEMEKVRSLFTKVSKVIGINLIQLDHVNISSVLQVESSYLRDLHDIIAVGKNNEWIWVNAGIETASARLLARIAPSKASPFNIEKWSEMVETSIGKLNDAGFFPFLSVVLGAPGETDADIQETLNLLEKIKKQRTAFFPVLYVSVDTEDPSFRMENMTDLQWELFRKAYEMNFRWVPKLYAENQKTGNVSFTRRMVAQMMGKVGKITARRRMKKLSAAKG